MLVTPTNIYKLDGSVGTFLVKVRAVSVGWRGDRRGHGATGGTGVPHNNNDFPKLWVLVGGPGGGPIMVVIRWPPLPGTRRAELSGVHATSQGPWESLAKAREG